MPNFQNGLKARYVPYKNPQNIGLSEERYNKVLWHLRNGKYKATRGSSSLTTLFDGKHYSTKTFLVILPDNDVYYVEEVRSSDSKWSRICGEDKPYIEIISSENRALV